MNKKRQHIIGLVACIILWFPVFPINAKEVCMTSCEWAPYASESLPKYGFTSEIIETAFKHSGYSVTFKFLPWKRSLRVVKEGKCDGVYSAYYTSEREIEYYVSDPYIESSVYLCTLKNKNIKYKNLRDLVPYTIGVTIGYSNSEEFDKADFLTKSESRNEVINLKKLLKGRVDLIVIDKYVALYNLKNSAFLLGSVSDIEFLEPPLTVRPVHVMFSKSVSDSEAKVRDFNKGLQLLKSKGAIDDLLIKYGAVE